VADTFAQLGDSLQKLHPPSLPMVHALNNGLMVTLIRAPGLPEKLGLDEVSAPPLSLTFAALAVTVVGLFLLRPRATSSDPLRPT